MEDKDESLPGRARHAVVNFNMSLVFRCMRVVKAAFYSVVDKQTEVFA